MSDTVWVFEDNGGSVSGVYRTPEQFVELTGLALGEYDENHGQRSYEVEVAREKWTFTHHLVEWEIGKHILDYLYPDGSRSMKPKA